MNSLLYFFIGFLITNVVEIVVASLLVRKDYLINAFILFVINCFSWPIANYIYSNYPNFLVIELCVFAVEALLIRFTMKVSTEKAILISLLINLTSAGIGLMLPLL